MLRLAVGGAFYFVKYSFASTTAWAAKFVMARSAAVFIAGPV
jgi:hypothetical protein